MTKIITKFSFALLLSSLILLNAGCQKKQCKNEMFPVASPIPDHIALDFDLDTNFYKKCVMAGPVPVVSSENVNDYALKEAAWLILDMMDYRPEILQEIGDRKVHLAIMGVNEFTSDIPEHSNFFKPKDKNFWDRRARGLGATDRSKTFSCGEENLLCYKGDPYWQENILIHEFAHVIHLMGLNKMDPNFDKRLQDTYEKACAAGKWKTFYAGSNSREYWAEAVQSWFNDNRENDHDHNHVNTRAELKEYDPDIAELVCEVFSDKPRKYKKPADRPESQRLHLVGYQTETAPEFVWPEILVHAMDNPPENY
ncbi:MAG: hypothetical protein JEZ07_06955 [Phycisphaerae bacterium]|nr:hypothetical protein [Phycisphaerae bacterium]